MSSVLEGWSNFPKTVRLLDLSLIGYGFLLSLSVILYLAILEHTVQNLMPIFLTAILLLFTWHFRTQLTKTTDSSKQRRFFLEWLILCTFVIVIIGLILYFYPVTY